MATKTAVRPQYRVKFRVVQLMSHPPIPNEQPVGKQFYQGALLPAWASDEEIAHLLSIDAIEVER